MTRSFLLWNTTEWYAPKTGKSSHTSAKLASCSRQASTGKYTWKETLAKHRVNARLCRVGSCQPSTSTATTPVQACPSCAALAATRQPRNHAFTHKAGPRTFQKRTLQSSRRWPTWHTMASLRCVQNPAISQVVLAVKASHHNEHVSLASVMNAQQSGHVEPAGQLSRENSGDLTSE